jgi:Secretion system C-terminal sorting domain
MLPDSNVDKPGSEGYITYTIRTKSGLPENTVVTNRAYIYFDQNSPVLTNITDNTMVSQIPVGIFRPDGNLNVSIYPNPFSQAINVRINNPKAVPYIFTVTDLQGRELNRTSLQPNSTKIDLSTLSPGIYLYRLINGQDNSSEVGRIVKY